LVHALEQTHASGSHRRFLPSCSASRIHLKARNHSACAHFRLLIFVFARSVHAQEHMPVFEEVIVQLLLSALGDKVRLRIPLQTVCCAFSI
jgi:hypothetical protein